MDATRETKSIVTSHFTDLERYGVYILLLIVVRFAYRRYSSPLLTYPGPFVASGSRAWKVWSTYMGHTEQDHIALHKTYGPVVRIAPNELSFASPRAAQDVLAAGKGFHKTDFYSVFPPPENPDIFTEVSERAHAQKKRMATVAYSLASMQRLAPRLDQAERILTDKLDKFASSGQVCDLGQWLHFFAFDVLGQVAFSKSFGFLAQGKDVDNTIRTIDNSQTYNGIVGQVPWIDYLLRRNPLWKYVPFLATKNALITRIAMHELEERKLDAERTVYSDILGQLLQSQKKEHTTLSEGDVFAIAHGAIFAGADSTASTMQTFLWHVLASPSVYQRLVSEIETIDSAGLLSETITYSEATTKLPYFQACLKEAMRIGPAVGLNMTRLVPSPHGKVDGHILPAGTRVALNAWVLHRDQGIFGEDADKYVPERWLLDERDDQSKEKLTRMDRCMFQFGGGSHLCIGRHLALLEMNKLLPQLLRRYNLQLVDPEKPLHHHSSFFVVQSGLFVKVQKR